MGFLKRLRFSPQLFAAEAEKKFLDKEGLTYLWGKIKSYIDGTDSGWLSPTMNSSFEVYTAGKPPKYRKIGKVVEVRGILKPKSTLSASSVGTEYTMFTLPAGYRPSDRISLLMQGSGMNKWMFDIGTDGVCSISRYGGTAVTDIPSGAWLSFQASYFVD